MIIYATLARVTLPLSALRNLAAGSGELFNCELGYLSRKIERLHFR